LIVPDIGNKVLDWAREAPTWGHRNRHPNAFENGLQQFDISLGQALQVLNLYPLATRGKLGKEGACPIKDRHFLVAGQGVE